MKTIFKASLIATAIASIPSGAYALGVGPINVLTGLGQPLRAEVPLTATPQELQTLTARIASPEVFRQANIQYSSALSLLKVSVDTGGPHPVLRISSDRPVNEPFLDLLLEFNWAAGKLVREYTFLLDPVDIAPPPPPIVPRTRAVPSPSAAPSGAAPQTASTAVAPRTDTEGIYVQRGDTLSRIARDHRPEGTSLDQVLIALQRANPGSFSNGNINRLRAGSILRIPTAEEVRAVSAREARREVLAHVADFDAYRQRLAAAAAPVDSSSAPATQESAGQITPRVEAPPPVAPGTDLVQISHAGDTSAPDSDQPLRERVRALEEDQFARESELKEAVERQHELERNVDELKRLLDLKNEQLADLQRRLESSPAAVPAEPLPQAEVSVESTAAPAVESAPAPVLPPEAEVTAAENVPAPSGPVAPPAQPPAASKPPAPARRPAPPPAPPPPSFLEEVFGSPLTLAAGGGVLALLLGYAGYKVRQRRKEDAGPDDDPEPLSVAPGTPNSVFGATGGQSVDTSSSSVLQTDFSHSGLSSIDTDEGVDPVAEADVYMAYGRDAQAEEILVDALKADSTRLAIYLKLLEVYASRKSLQQFETTAAELYARTEGNGPEWTKAAAMGCEIDPGNPLYAGDGQIPAKGLHAEGDLRPGNAVMPGAAAVSQDVPAIGEQSAFASMDSLDVPDSGLPDQPPPAAMGSVPEQVPTSAKPVAQNSPPPVVAAEAPAAGSEADANVLDFDLDLGLSEPSAAEAAQFPEADELALDFDLPAAAPPAEKAVEPVIVTPAAAFDAASTMADTSDAFIGGQADERELDLESAEATLFDLADTVIQSSGTFDSDGVEEGADLGENSFDNNLMDFDLEIDAPPQAPASGSPAADLSGIDLDLDPSAAGGAPAEAAPASKAAEPAAPDDLPDQETETKLELARAYEEMGDKEGARELLEEVLREGSPAQQGVARDLLARFG